MHTTPDQRLLEFIRKFRVDLTPEGTITRLELYHSIEGSMGERLATFEMADRDDDEDPDDLAQEIWDEAEQDSATRPTGSVERYVIQAFRGDTREPDDLHALVVRMCEATAGSAAVQLERERQENNRLREVAFEYEKLRQQLLDNSLDRELKRKEAEASNQQMQMLFGTMLQLAPLVLQRLLMPPAPPGAALPLQPAPAPTPPAPAPAPAADSSVNEHVKVRDAMIAQLLGTFSMEQMQAMLGTFDAAQKQQFLAVYTSFREHPPTPSAAASESSQGAPSDN
jgi:hypothetical protein